jgi:integrase
VAHIRKLPSGNWNAVVRHPSGKKISKTDPLKRAVTAWAAEQEASFRNGAPAPARATFSQWCDRWLRVRAVRKATARKDASRLRLHIRPYWDSWPLQSITRMDVQEWVNRMADGGLGAPTVHGTYQLMATCMAEALGEGMIAVNPCQRIKLPTRAKPEPRWFTRHEYDRILLALADRTIASGGRKWGPDPHRHVYRALVALACFTGMRPQELAGLDVRYLDLERRLVHVRQTLTRDGLVPYGKSDRANRWIPYPAEVAELLWPVVADKPDTAPVFTAPRGGRVEFEGNFRSYVWVPTLLAAGIEPVRFYVCRHTCASWLVQAGVPDRQIMAVLGHADAHLIDVYGHLAPDAHDAVRAAWGEDSRPTYGPRRTLAHDAESGNRWSEASLDGLNGS